MREPGDPAAVFTRKRRKCWTPDSDSVASCPASQVMPSCLLTCPQAALHSAVYFLGEPRSLEAREQHHSHNVARYQSCAFFKGCQPRPLFTCIVYVNVLQLQLGLQRPYAAPADLDCTVLSYICRTATPAKVKGCIKAKVERHTALRNNHLTAYCSVYCWTVPLLISCSSSSRKLFGTSSSVHANCGHICRPAA